MIHAVVLVAAHLLTPAVELDFSTVATGLEYRVDFEIKDPTGNVLVSGPFWFGDTATTKDIRDGFEAGLGDARLELVKIGDHKLRIASKGVREVGPVTYNTSVKGKAKPLAGPKVIARFGGATFTTNGNQL